MKTIALGAGLLTLLACAAACGSEEPRSAPIVEPAQVEPAAQPQVEEPPAEFTVADAVRLVAETGAHADEAAAFAQDVVGCDVDSERAAVSTFGAWESAQESRAALGVGLAIYLETASLSDLDGANDLLASADAAVERARASVDGLGSCGPLADAQIVVLIDRMNDATTEVSLMLSHIGQAASWEVCYPRNRKYFERFMQARDEFIALRKQYDEGAGSRERKRISSEVHNLGNIRQNFNLKLGAASFKMSKYEECE